MDSFKVWWSLNIDWDVCLIYCYASEEQIDNKCISSVILAHGIIF